MKILFVLIFIGTIFFTDKHLISDPYNLLKRSLPIALDSLIKRNMDVDIERIEHAVFVVNVVKYDSLNNSISYSISIIHNQLNYNDVIPQSYLLMENQIILIKSDNYKNLFENDSFPPINDAIKNMCMKKLFPNVGIKKHLISYVSMRSICTIVNSDNYRTDLEFFDDIILMPQEYYPWPRGCKTKKLNIPPDSLSKINNIDSLFENKTRN